MIKKLLLGALLTISFTNAQNLITEGFDDVPALSSTYGWTNINCASAVGTIPNWIQGVDANFPPYAGPANSYAGGHYNNVSGANTISTWLITPALGLQNGDVIKFWTRTVDAPGFADRLQVRLNSTAGANPALLNPTDVGGFSTLLLDVNPGLTLAGYPNVWTEQTITVTGLTGVVPCKLAFRYYVTNGGPSGANSDFIGVDSFTIDRPLSSQSFTLSGIKMYPNPAKDVLNIQSEVEELTKVSITDLNGRIVKEVTNNVSQISLGDLSNGIYTVTIESATAKKVEKLIVE
jgi:hypothetical protein